MKNAFKTIFGIAWLIGLFALVGFLFNKQAMYVAIAIWFACLVVLYIWSVRAYGFKDSLRVCLYLAGLMPEIKKEVKERVTGRIK